MYIVTYIFEKISRDDMNSKIIEVIVGWKEMGCRIV